jgi:hypothetical protein
VKEHARAREHLPRVIESMIELKPHRAGLIPAWQRVVARRRREDEHRRGITGRNACSTILTKTTSITYGIILFNRMS